jgi:elongator complex protein 1
VLVLSLARRLLDGGHPGPAFYLLRRHRVDLNFMIDHAPARFLVALPQLVHQVPSTEDLNLLISALNTEDCVRHKYPPPPSYGRQQEGQESDEVAAWFPHDKPNRICEALRQVLLDKSGLTAAILPVLTTYAKQVPPQLEKALSIIGAEAKRQRQKLSGDVAQRLIKYLAFFVNIDKLYDTSLGLYDFDLVRAVARQSQKDPREYLPFLESLEQMVSWRAKVTVDVELKRYRRALEHLSGE